MKHTRWLILAGTLVLLIARVVCSEGQTASADGPHARVPQLAILDTDIGDDIDDAFALALVLQSPELRLLGITTTSGDTELRARLVDRYLRAVGREDIPVAAGTRMPGTSHFTQGAYARRMPGRKHADAVGFLLRQIREHPGQITLIAIGPLFNVQEAIRRDPATFRKLKRVVMMGGSIYRGYEKEAGDTHEPPSAEWNIHCDPAGARDLLASGVPIFMMPLDSTQIRLEQQAQTEIFSQGSPLTDQLTLLFHQWSGSGKWRTPVLYDPVAVAYAIRPELCPMTAIHLEVDDQGFTRAAKGQPNVQVCLQSNETGFLDLLLDRIAGQPAP